jgi:PhnB protein
MAIQPYLFFNGRTIEALEYYKKTLGAEMRIGGALVMASDGMQADGKPRFAGFSLTYEAKDPGDAKRRFDAVAKDGQVQMPFGETFFAEAFGGVQDKFGVSWMFIAGAKQS